MDASNYQVFQIVFYTLSLIATLLAVGTAYLAIHRQSMPSILVYYEPSLDRASVIDLVICNHGNGTARDIGFSEVIPIHCWEINEPQKISIHLIF